MNLNNLIQDAYRDATGMEIDPVNMERAHKFVTAIFNHMPVVGYTDGTTLVEEQWMLEDAQPVWRKPDAAC